MKQITVTKRTPTQDLLAGILFLLLLTGCTEGQVLNSVPDEAQPITLLFTSPNLGSPKEQTRANISEHLPIGVTVRIAAYFRKAADSQVTFETTPPTYQATYEVQPDGSLSPCTVDTDGKKTGSGTALTVRGGTYDFYAVSPARTLEIPTTTPPTSSYQMTGIQHKEDVMTSFVRNVTVAANSNTVALNTFTRKCARVVFNVEPDAGNAVPIVSLKGKKLVLKGFSESPASLITGENYSIPATRGEVNDPNAQLEFTDSEFVEFTSPDGSMKLNKTIGAILPKTAGLFDVAITVERDGQTAELTATIDRDNNISFDPGKSYVFTLRIKNSKASLYMKVLDWNTHTVTDPNVGTLPGPVPPTDPDIVPGVGIPIQVAEWNNITWTGNGNAGNTKLITIDQNIANAYKAKGYNLSLSPPFNYDQGLTSGVGIDYKGNSNACTVATPYVIQVEDIQSPVVYLYEDQTAINYCKNKEPKDNWRLPMMIELFAMWDKARGSDKNAADNEEASEIYDAPFIPNFYWSSSVYSGSSSDRCNLNFSNGTLNTYGGTGSGGYVRCVREVTP